MLRACGLKDEDFKKPLVGVANTWIEIGPCNYHLRELAEHVKAGIRAAGGTPLEFNTVSISDGITMGTEGMRTSLVSREVITDSIELVARGNLFDALVVLVGCDKTIPGGVMALARLNIPGLVLYGGSIAPGKFEDRAVTIQDVYEAIGAHARGRMSDAQLKTLESSACPGAGACGGQFTDNTMHDLKVERFYKGRAEGPIKTFPLRGIKDHPPYLHDGRLLTLEDAVEFFNIVLHTQLTAQEKMDLVQYLRAL